MKIEITDGMFDGVVLPCLKKQLKCVKADIIQLEAKYGKEKYELENLQDSKIMKKHLKEVIKYFGG